MAACSAGRLAADLGYAAAADSPHRVVPVGQPLPERRSSATRGNRPSTDRRDTSRRIPAASAELRGVAADRGDLLLEMLLLPLLVRSCPGRRRSASGGRPPRRAARRRRSRLPARPPSTPSASCRAASVRSRHHLWLGARSSSRPWQSRLRRTCTFSRELLVTRWFAIPCRTGHTSSPGRATAAVSSANSLVHQTAGAGPGASRSGNLSRAISAARSIWRQERLLPHALVFQQSLRPAAAVSGPPRRRPRRATRR